jgi:hypothetical protein
MTTRRLPLAVRFLAFAALVALAAVVMYRTGEPIPTGAPPIPSFAEAHDRIEVGMTEADVDRLCGRASDWAIPYAKHAEFGVPCAFKRWLLEDGEVWLWVGEDGRVLGKTYSPKGSVRP